MKENKENFKSYANSFQAVPRLGLERIERLLFYMGNPHKNMNYIHVAGTNGKGSVCAYIYAAYLNKKINVGRYISPNLVKVNERISVNGEDISDEELNTLIFEVEDASRKVYAELSQEVSQFEIWTAAAFLYFKKKKCDVVVLETGLGGRFDATNVIEENLLSIITKIDVDHVDYLGDTKEKITFEKCGIIKCPKNGTGKVLTTCSNDDVLPVIKEQAHKKNNEVIVTGEFIPKGFEKIYECFDYKDIKDITLSLGGYHQIENACMAIEALKILGFSGEEIKSALCSAKNPARLELIYENPYILFDGAHNPDGIGALKKSIDRYFNNERKIYVMASMSDKDILPSLSILKDNKSEFVFTTVQNNPRARTPEKMAKEAEKLGIKSLTFPNLKDALLYVKKKKMLTVICGSLYLYKDYAEIHKN